jgi:putative ATP-binding cassette transporter
MTPSEPRDRFDWRLWQQFVALTQPYWYPVSRRHNWIFPLLLALLLVFLAALLTVMAGATVWLGHHFLPKMFDAIAPGLANTFDQLEHSPFLAGIGLCLLVPLVVFVVLNRRLRSRWQPWMFLAVLLLLSLAVSGLNVIISYVGRYFQTALAQKDQPTYWRFLWVYAGVFVVGTPIVVYYSYIQDWLSLLWRRWLTNRFIDQYLGDRAYYSLNANRSIDNPDQRISEDIRAFTDTSLSFVLTILNAIISLVAFTGILWSISQPLTLVLLVYSLVGTVVTVWFGKRLIGFNFNQLRQEANFRYNLVHVRDNAESIAFYQGEPQLSTQLKQRFMAAFSNFNLLIGWQRNLGFFTQSFNYFALILPSFVIAPLYFAGKIDFGAISQAGLAFDQVFSALSLIVSQFNSISAFAAGVARLEHFKQAMTQASSQPLRPSLAKLETRVAADLKLEHFTLYTPNYERILINDLSVTLAPHQGLLIMGQSGCGKSSLLRAIAGLWHSASGLLLRPPLEEMLFLPQRPYMIIGNLQEQLLYPQSDRVISEAALRAVLERVNLADLPERVGGFQAELDWADVLSLGEQQRLAFARLLLMAPRYAMLDEATSALDAQNEAELYQQLQTLGTTIISIGHRTSLSRYHQRLLALDVAGGWQLLPLPEKSSETVVVV